MLRHPCLPTSASRPLELTIERAVITSSSCLIQQPLSVCLTCSPILQSPSNTLRHSSCPCPSTSSELELRARPYSFGPSRTLAEMQGCRPHVQDRRIYAEWIDEKLEPRRGLELRQRHPGVVSPCWTLVATDRGQFISFLYKRILNTQKNF